jgi:O-antigen/teichoic acid export membrane protein
VARGAREDRVSTPAIRLRTLATHPLLTNSTALIALRATNLLARLALLFTIAHVVPPAAFGLVVFALSVTEIGKVAADFGMDTLAIREFAADTGRESHARFAASLAAAKVVFGAVVYAVLAAWFTWKGPREQAQVGLIIGTTALTALLISYSIDWFQARLRIARVFVPVALLNTLFAAAAVLLVPRLHDLRLQAALFPALELVSGLVLLVWLGREELLAPPLFAFGRVRALVAQSLPIAMTGLLIMFYSRLDVLVLSSRLGPAQVGHYGIAYRLTEPVQIAAAAFGLSVFSRFSGWFRDPARLSLRRPALRYVLATLAYGAVCALALGLLAPPVIRRFFADYVPAIPVLRVLAAGLVFRSVNATLAAILQGAGRFRLLTGIATWNLAAVFGMLTLFVGRFGAPGAALALLTVEGLNTVIQLVLVSRVLAQHERTASGGA